MTGKAGRSGGKREGAGRKSAKNRSLVHVTVKGALPPMYLTPLQFCLAVMNNDLAALGIKDKKKGPSVGQRLDAARIAAPYQHQKLPEVVKQDVVHSWADVMMEAEERRRTMREQIDDGRVKQRGEAVH